MKTISNAQAELIEAVIAEQDVGALTAAILEKDIHVTDALSTLLRAPLPGAKLVFCGGTSLSKAHHIIQRMSEDVDLKLVLTPYEGQSRSQDKKRLKALKAEVIARLADSGLAEVADETETSDEHRQVQMAWAYEPRYDGTTTLRPHLKLEYKQGAPALPTTTMAIHYLVDELANRPQIQLQAECLSASETLAEKVLAFLRRHAQVDAPADWDATLVRHLHDVHCIAAHRPDCMAEACTVFPALVAAEATRYQGQFPHFAANPKAVLAAALAALDQSAVLEADYRTKLLGLLFALPHPSYAQVLASFQAAARQLIATL